MIIFMSLQFSKKKTVLKSQKSLMVILNFLKFNLGMAANFE